jgi:outer membrane protein TolC
MRISKPALMAIPFPIVLAGCGVGSSYRPPALTPPAAFMGEAAVGAINANQPEADLATWWTAFGDPLMPRFVEKALAQNLDLQQASAKVMEARAALRRSNADMLPTGQASAQARSAYQSLETPEGRIASTFPGFDREAQSYDLGVSASWELDLFGGKDAVRDAARADWQASAAAATAARLAIAAQTADTYLAIRSVQARLQLARDQQQVQQKLVDLAPCNIARAWLPKYNGDRPKAHWRW